MKKIILINTMFLLSTAIAFAQYSTAGSSSNSFTSASNNTIYTRGVPEKAVFNFSDSSQNTGRSSFYFTRSRNQKAAGWCFLSGGAVVLAIGLASFPTNGNILFSDPKDEAKADRATNVTIIGAVIMCSSIPFFICANASKRKAKLYLNSEKTAKGIPLQTGTVTGLTVGLSLGK